MTNKEIKQLVNVIQINPDSTSIIFLDGRYISQLDAYHLGKALKKSGNADFGAICLVPCNPSDAVKLVSAKDLKA